MNLNYKSHPYRSSLTNWTWSSSSSLRNLQRLPPYSLPTIIPGREKRFPKSRKQTAIALRYALP